MSNNVISQEEIKLEPVITYKSTLLATEKCYTFIVPPLANKYQIKEAFERIYDATALKVNTVAVRTSKRRTKKGYTQKQDMKKAYIWTDKELDIFPKA